IHRFGSSRSIWQAYVYSLCDICRQLFRAAKSNRRNADLDGRLDWRRRRFADGVGWRVQYRRVAYLQCHWLLLDLQRADYRRRHHQHVVYKQRYVWTWQFVRRSGQQRDNAAGIRRDGKYILQFAVLAADRDRHMPDFQCREFARHRLDFRDVPNRNLRVWRNYYPQYFRDK